MMPVYVCSAEPLLEQRFGLKWQ